MVMAQPASSQLGIPIGTPGPPSWLPKLELVLQQRALLLSGHSRVIIRAASGVPAGSLATLILSVGGTAGRALGVINAQVADIPNVSIPVLAASSLVGHISLDRAIAGSLERTGATIGASAVRDSLSLDGTGVGIAVIDSGITPWHDDLAGPTAGTQRVDRFVDFVNGRPAAYDDYGHGTHVAGIIAGNGFDSSGARSGIAPAAHLVVLKVLDGYGRGSISNVIAALDYVVSNKDALNIRIVNLSVAAGVYESYDIDPLTLAAQRAVNAGVVVVAAAGNNGRSSQGTTQYGGVTAPGNAPWVLTVGASSHMGTIDRADDTMAAFSSRGPGAVDYKAKPDLVAPAVGIESLSVSASLLYGADTQYLLPGTVPTSYLPYLSLSGTSMAAPVVAGTVALMLQANPELTPNEVKAILQYTSQVYAGYDALTEGAGFLNAKGAVELARFFATPGGTYPTSPDWSGRLVWGTRLVLGGRLTDDANAWTLGVTWGASTTASGLPIDWGVIGLSDRWTLTSGSSQNVVWGTMCGGADCGGPWNHGVVFGTTGDATVVWGTSDEQTVVWGTSCDDPSCQPVIWNR
jgi:serine protease AprX